MSLYQTVFNFVFNLVDHFGYAGIFALMVMESATLPVPSEVILPLAGYMVFLGHIDFWVAVVIATVGSLAGTLIDYALGFYLGRAAVLRYGKSIRINERHLEWSERWFSKYGEIAVLAARFVPLIRTLVAFPAGFAKMSTVKFIVFSLVGILVWDAALIYAGDVAGQNSDAIIAALHNVFLPLEIAAAIAAVILLVFLFRRARARGEEKISEK